MFHIIAYAICSLIWTYIALNRAVDVLSFNMSLAVAAINIVMLIISIQDYIKSKNEILP